MNKSGKKPPGLMTRFRHAALPLPGDADHRALAALRELSKLNPHDTGNALPDYPYIEKLVDKGLGSGDARTLNRIAQYLIEHDQDELAKKVIAGNGFPLDYADLSTGETLLHLAVMMRSIPVVAALLNAGAKMDVRDRNGQTPADIAYSRGFSPTMTVIAEMLGRATPKAVTEPPPPAKEQWHGDMRAQIEDIISLDAPVTAPKAARFRKTAAPTV